MRTGPGARFRDIGDVGLGRNLHIFDYDRIGRWARMRWHGRSGWVSTRYWSGETRVSNGAGGPSRLGPHLVTAIGPHDPDGGLNIRTGAGTRFGVVAVLPLSTEVCVIRLNRDGVRAFVTGRFGSGYVRAKHLVKKLTPSQSGSGQNNSGGQNGQNAPTVVNAPDGLPLPAIFSVVHVAANDRLWVRRALRHASGRLTRLAPNARVQVLSYLSNGWVRVSVGRKIGPKWRLANR